MIMNNRTGIRAHTIHWRWYWHLPGQLIPCWDLNWSLTKHDAYPCAKSTIK